MPVQIEQILKKIEAGKRLNSSGEEKISRVLENKEVDKLPLIFWKPRNQTVPGWTYDMNEQFYDKEKMLLAHLEEILDCAAEIHDAVVCLRPNFGTIFIPAILGLPFQVPDNTFPWLTSHLSKEEVRELREQPCIRCGACVRECPVRVLPTMINAAAQKKLWESAKVYGA